MKKARDAGIVVVTTNTSLAPMTAADAAYETDNLQAGVLIGQWASDEGLEAERRAGQLQGRLKGRTYGRVLFNEAPFTFLHELLAILGH